MKLPFYIELKYNISILFSTDTKPFGSAVEYLTDCDAKQFGR